MKLTERHIREFFPRDMRFTHYVAKRYGYNFKDEFAVEKANAIAMERVIHMYNEGMEFDSKEHLYGYIITAFKFSILNSFDKRAADKLEYYNESELTYGDGDEEYNKFLATAAVQPDEYSNSTEKIIQIMKATMNPIEFRVFELKYNYDYNTEAIARDLELSHSKVSTIQRRIKIKFNKIKQKLDEDGIESEKERAQNRKNKAIERARQQADLRLRIEARNKRIEEDEKERIRRAEALSWINTNSKIQYDI
jgi:RNA polymerase sigma factor (sigma-70 family)